MSEPSVYDIVEASSGAPVCVCCPQILPPADAEGGWLVCRRCQTILAGRIGEVAALWPQVDRADRQRALTRAGGNSIRSFGAGSSSGSKAQGSPTPGNDMTVLNLVAGDVAARLEVHEDAWRTAQGWSERPPRGRRAVEGACRFLDTNLLWACQSHPAVADLERDLRRLVGEMQAVVTGERRHVITLQVTCPYTAPGWENGDPEAPACGGTLRCDVGKAMIRCADCWATVPTEYWLELGITVGTIDINQEVA